MSKVNSPITLDATQAYASYRSSLQKNMYRIEPTMDTMSLKDLDAALNAVNAPGAAGQASFGAGFPAGPRFLAPAPMFDDPARSSLAQTIKEATASGASKTFALTKSAFASMWEMFRNLMARIARLFGAKVELPDNPPAEGESVEAGLAPNEPGQELSAEQVESFKQAVDQAVSEPAVAMLGERRYEVLKLAREAATGPFLGKTSDQLLTHFYELSTEARNANAGELMAVETAIEAYADQASAQYGMQPYAFKDMLDLAIASKNENILTMFDPQGEYRALQARFHALSNYFEEDEKSIELFRGEMNKRGLSTESPFAKPLQPNFVSPKSAKSQDAGKIAIPKTDISDKISLNDVAANQFTGLHVVGGGDKKVAEIVSAAGQSLTQKGPGSSKWSSLAQLESEKGTKPIDVQLGLVDEAEVSIDRPRL